MRPWWQAVEAVRGVSDHNQRLNETPGHGDSDALRSAAGLSGGVTYGALTGPLAVHGVQPSFFARRLWSYAVKAGADARAANRTTCTCKPIRYSIHGRIAAECAAQAVGTRLNGPSPNSVRRHSRSEAGSVIQTNS